MIIELKIYEIFFIKFLLDDKVFRVRKKLIIKNTYGKEKHQ